MSWTSIYAPTYKSVDLRQSADARTFVGDAVAANSATVLVL